MKKKVFFGNDEAKLETSSREIKWNRFENVIKNFTIWLYTSMIAGCDEAGAGPGFGDLVASAVILTTPIEGLTDSKKLSEKKRDAYFKQITESCIFGIGNVSNVEIDQHGLAI